MKDNLKNNQLTVEELETICGGATKLQINNYIITPNFANSSIMITDTESNKTIIINKKKVDALCAYFKVGITLLGVKLKAYLKENGVDSLEDLICG